MSRAANGIKSRFKKGFDRRRNYHGRAKGSKNKRMKCPNCGCSFKRGSEK